MKSRYYLSLLALSTALSLMPAQAQVAGDTTSTSPLQTFAPIITQLLTTASSSNLNYPQMIQQYLQNNPNFQQQNPNGYNQLINNPQVFFNNQNYQGWNQGNWQNTHTQSNAIPQVRIQQFLQNHPNFQQEHPDAYNQLINNPQSFFANRHSREDSQNWQNQDNNNNNWSNQDQSLYRHRRHRQNQDYQN